MVGSSASSPEPPARPSTRRRFALLALAVLLAAFPGGTAVPQSATQTESDPRIEVEVRNGLVSLDARNAPLDEVIRKIGALAGFETVVQRPLDTQITRSLVEVPVYDAVRRLARDILFVMIHAPAAAGEEAGPIREVRLYRPLRHRPPPTGTTPPNEGLDTAVLTGLSAEDATARLRAVRTLRQAGAPAALAVLEDVVREDRNPLVRGQAVAALGTIGGERALAPLQAALADPEESVRVQAARTIGRIGTEASARILGEVLLHGVDRRLRRVAAWSLGGMQGDLARSYLEAALIDPDSAVRRSADQGLAQWTDNRSGESHQGDL